MCSSISGSMLHSFLSNKSTVRHTHEHVSRSQSQQARLQTRAEPRHSSKTLTLYKQASVNAPLMLTSSLIKKRASLFLFTQSTQFEKNCIFLSEKSLLSPSINASTDRTGTWLALWGLEANWIWSGLSEKPESTRADTGRRGVSGWKALSHWRSTGRGTRFGH